MRFHRFLHASIVSLAAAFAAGCGDPPPPAPQGAWFVNFGPGVDAAACSVAQHTTKVGEVSETDPGKLVRDGGDVGTSQASVSCSVIGSDKFNVNAQATLKGSSLKISVDNLSPSATEDAPALGKVIFADTATAGIGYAPADAEKLCEFYFADGSRESVASGKVWVAFRCPDLAVSSPKSNCQISQGYANFGNCREE